MTLNLPVANLTVNVKRSGVNQSTTTVRLQLGPMSISVNGTTDANGNVTFTNVPVGTGYTIKAFKTACSGSPLRSVTVTNQTKTAVAQTINVSFNSDACPVA